MKNSPLLPCVLLVGALLPALLSAGCGGGTDGSRPASGKAEAPRVSGNLTFADVSEGALVDATPLVGIASLAPATLTNTRVGAATAQKLVLSVKTENAVESTLALSLGSSASGSMLMQFRAGQQLEFPRAGSNIEFTQNSAETMNLNRWRVSGGAVVVRSINAKSAELFFDGVLFEPADVNSKLGSFTLSGTLSARDLTVN